MHPLLQVIPEGRDIDWTLIESVLPVEKLRQTPQDPVYHAEGDVWTHTRMVCEAMVNDPVFQQAGADKQRVLFLAALLHDIAKPSCTQTQFDGRITSKGHSARGAIDARIMLWQAGMNFHERESICRLISLHQVPFHLMDQEDCQWRAIKTSWSCDSIEDLCTLANADLLGRRSLDTHNALLNTELLRSFAEDENCLHQPRPFPDDATKVAYFSSSGSISPDYPFFSPPGAEVIVLSGLPASGKDTWAEANCGHLPALSFDDARAQIGARHGSNAAGAAVHHVIEKAKEFLRKKTPFVWNATHLSNQMRSKTLDLLHRYSAKTTIVYLESDPKTIFDRNSARDSTLRNADIERMLCRWEPPLPFEAHQVRYDLQAPSPTQKLRF